MEREVKSRPLPPPSPLTLLPSPSLTQPEQPSNTHGGTMEGVNHRRYLGLQICLFLLEGSKETDRGAGGAGGGSKRNVVGKTGQLKVTEEVEESRI